MLTSFPTIPVCTRPSLDSVTLQTSVGQHSSGTKINMSTLETNTDEDQRHDLETIETRSTGDTTNCETSSVVERQYKNIVHLWEFLLELLADESCNTLIAWSRKTQGEFRIKNPKEVASRWGSLKQKQGMNYEKLSRGLRHYYKQGIIEKVKGQRLVYKFHKLPYHYTPRKTNYLELSRMLPTNSKRQGEYSFKDYLSSSSENLDESERMPTDKEKMKKIFQERVNAKQNMNQHIHTEQEVPGAATSPLPQVYSELLVPISIRPSVCTRACEFQVVNQPTFTCEIVSPVSDNRQQNTVSYGLNYGGKGVPVSVIKRFQSAQTDAGEHIKQTRKGV